jgi:ABC-type transport system involved in multi-copper enzyme maturation permease subunit
LNPLAKSVGFAAAVALAPVVGIRAASSVARERQRQTLDALFSLPVPRRQVLRAKWLAPLVWVRFWLAGVGAVVLFAAVVGSVHPLGLLAASALLTAFVLFSDTLGVWLSTRFHSATRAVTALVVLMIVFFLAPLLLSTLIRSSFQLAGEQVAGLGAEQFVDTISVPYAVYQALFRWGDLHGAAGARPQTAVVSGFLCAVAYSVFGWVLWRDAVRHFDREGT